MMFDWRAGTSNHCIGVAVGMLLTTQLSTAYTLDMSSTDSMKRVASSMTQDMMSFYNGHQPGGIPGLLPPPYYWWEAGALMGALVDYWYYTGDTTWNSITEEGLLFQAGPNHDYMPLNQTMTEGNDDQGFWAMASMSAAEYNFPNPPADKPQWLALTQAVFNTQAARWDEQECGGGLRWQIFTWNNGFDYKNSISQACFFNIGARLARYTGNQTYADWADKTWTWMEASGLLDKKTYYVYDGSHTNNCSEITPYQWTYNAGAFLLGAAAMYNYTTGPTQARWRTRIDGLLNGTRVFFAGPKNNIMSEVACEPVNLCDLDQQSFKAYLSRWMAATIKWAPWTYNRIKPLLASSATAAASTCTGGDNGRMCGLKWTDHGKHDGSIGVGQQMAAMEIVLANMIQHVPDPLTNSTGGTSAGDPAAGGSDVGRTDPFTIIEYPPPTPADRTGACVCTILILLGLVFGCIFVLSDENKVASPPKRLSRWHWAVMPRGGRGLRRMNVGNLVKGKHPNHSDSDGSLMYEKDDVMVKTHYVVPIEKIGRKTSSINITPRRHHQYHHQRARSGQPDALKYWNHDGTNAGQIHPPHSELQSEPSVLQPQKQNSGMIRKSTSLQKKAMQNRVVHWKEKGSNQYT
ncbi:glycosyl hydrolase family 76-domain-containing protein [Podospora appendiculata]|uniref:mannan endo-1,6-alpha-mannosidase n=1 Tax=Podospora appendiculata TaxID=314037 RepID=A0AAE0XL72_9PEZI|nr:glycosyl hydrolase family 76-domain-containing protein [Podospora appendiculata]